jgi:glycerophosphoryl diester phosphodiesterase
VTSLLREQGRPIVIGHRGAAAVAPENTLESLRQAVSAGADFVEFDVGPDLLLAHSDRESPAEPLTLDAALEYLKAQGVGVQVDVKGVGYEDRIVEALRRHVLPPPVIVSSAFPATLRTIRGLQPDVVRSIGYPQDRYGISRLRWPSPAVRLGAACLRAAVPLRLRLLVRRSGADAIALHHTLCSAAAVRYAHANGKPLFAWTVNDPRAVRRLAALGVDGIVSDDPGMALATLRAP